MMNALQSQKGIAAVEFLIVLPLLLSVLLVITEFGQAFITFNTLNKLAQNGVRYATSDIQGTSSYDQIADVSKIKNIVVYGKSAPSDGDVSLVEGLSVDDVSVDHSSGYVTVSVDYSYSPISSFPSSLDLNFPLDTSAVMRTLP